MSMRVKIHQGQWDVAECMAEAVKIMAQISAIEDEICKLLELWRLSPTNRVFAKTISEEVIGPMDVVVPVQQVVELKRKELNDTYGILRSVIERAGGAVERLTYFDDLPRDETLQLADYDEPELPGQEEWREQQKRAGSDESLHALQPGPEEHTKVYPVVPAEYYRSQRAAAEATNSHPSLLSKLCLSGALKYRSVKGRPVLFHTDVVKALAKHRKEVQKWRRSRRSTTL